MLGLILAVDSGHQSVKDFSSTLAKKSNQDQVNQDQVPDAEDLLQVSSSCPFPPDIGLLSLWKFWIDPNLQVASYISSDWMQF